MAWKLCSKSDVAALHPINVEDLMDVWSEMVESMIKQELGTPYLGELEDITDEEHDGDGTAILRVRKPPVSSVTALSANGKAYLESEYAVTSTGVVLRYEKFPKGILNAKISYESGSLDIDSTVQLCAVAMIVAIINYNRRMGADSSFKFGVVNRQVGEPSPNLNVGLTSHLKTIMKRTLRRPRVRVR